MTTVAAWIAKERESPDLWIASDSRLSNTDGQGIEILLDRCAKVFAIPMIVRRPGVEGFFDDVCFVRSLGFGFAGSAQVGFNTVAVLSTLFTNLNLLSPPLPSLQDLAQLASEVLSELVREIGSRRPSVTSEALLAGSCPRTKEFRVFHLQRDLSQSMWTAVPKEIPVQSGEVLLLGDQKEVIRDEIRALVEQVGLDTDAVSAIRRGRAPKVVIERLIAERRFPSIGGHLQVGIDSGQGFKLFSTHDSELGSLQLLGFRLPPFKPVGAAVVAVNGMA